jgi:hypothetical protein
MEISDIEQEISDINWFAVDAEYSISSMSSNGGRLPLSVASSAEDNYTLVEFFDSLATPENAFIINKNFQLPDTMQRSEQRRIFFQTFSLQSARGLYSFSRNEKDISGIWSDREYSLVTIPSNPICFTTLPKDIQTILSKTSYNGIFKHANILNLENIL